MSNSNLVDVKVPAYVGNYTKGRSGKKISEITIHHMAGILTVEQCGKIFQKKGRKGSAHYGIGNDGKIGLYVDEKNTAWTNSNWASNCRAVTIEVSNANIGDNWEVSTKALNSLIELVADIAKRNDISLAKGETLTWHQMYSATTCPGPYLLSKIDYIIEKANKKISKKDKKTYSEKFPKLPLRGYFYYDDKNKIVRDKGKQVKKLQGFLNWALDINLDIDGSLGPATHDAILAYQKKYKLTKDGLFGPKCLEKAKNIKK